MTMDATKPQDDQDAGKGAVESDTPDDQQNSNPAGTGIDEEGLPDDPRDREDEIGANEDREPRGERTDQIGCQAGRVQRVPRQAGPCRCVER
jgi:hypothetical protein